MEQASLSLSPAAKLDLLRSLPAHVVSARAHCLHALCLQ